MDFHESLTVLVAKNGEGKTSILDAIAVGLGTFIGKMPDSRGHHFANHDIRLITDLVSGQNVPLGQVSVNMDMNIEQNNNIHVSRSLTLAKSARTTTGGANKLSSYAEMLIRSQSDPKITWPLAAYYGAGRLWGANKQTQQHKKAMLTQERRYGYADAMNPNSGYKEFSLWFADLRIALLAEMHKYGNGSGFGSGRGEGFGNGDGSGGIGDDLNQMRRFKLYNNYNNALNEVFSKVLQPSGWKELDYDFDTKKIVVVNDQKSGTSRIDVNMLSAGVQICLGLVADLAYRCCQLNPHMGETAPLKTNGIVLIDEIELHLHPAWQQQILGSLRKAFPNIQFIVTTHSPQVISSVSKECIRIISNGQVVPSEIETEGARAEQVLNEIFGTDSRVGSLPIVKDLNEYKKLIAEDKWDSKEALEIKHRLYENLSSDPELSRLAIDVKVKEYKRGSDKE